VTTATLKILVALDQASPDDQMFGLRICQHTGLGSGTVYPVLDRLERADWVTGEWAQQPSGRRRHYKLSETGTRALGRVRGRQLIQARSSSRFQYARYA